MFSPVHSLSPAIWFQVNADGAVYLLLSFLTVLIWHFLPWPGTFCLDPALLASALPVYLNPLSPSLRMTLDVLAG